MVGFSSFIYHWLLQKIEQNALRLAYNFSSLHTLCSHALRQKFGHHEEIWRKKLGWPFKDQLHNTLKHQPYMWQYYVNSSTHYFYLVWPFSREFSHCAFFIPHLRVHGIMPHGTIMRALRITKFPGPTTIWHYICVETSRGGAPQWWHLMPSWAFKSCDPNPRIILTMRPCLLKIPKGRIPPGGAPCGILSGPLSPHDPFESFVSVL